MLCYLICTAIYDFICSYFYVFVIIQRHKKFVFEIEFVFNNVIIFGRFFRYIGRRPAAAAATGGYKNHVQEQKEFVDRALSFET